jgi:hypothetical protein
MNEFYFEYMLDFFYFEVLLNMSDACCYFFNIRLAMVSKHSELAKRQARDRYRIFASPLSRTTPPPLCCREVGSSSRRHTALPSSSDDLSVEMWEVPPPPPPTCLGDSSSTSSGYNDEYPHVKEVSSYELLLDFNYLV